MLGKSQKIKTCVNQNENDSETLKYLNLLSDYLFTFAKNAAQHDGVEETNYNRPDLRFKITFVNMSNIQVLGKSQKIKT